MSDEYSEKNGFRPPVLPKHYAEMVRTVAPGLVRIVESTWNEAWHLGATAGLERNTQPIRLLPPEGERLADLRAARRTASEAADRFRDVLIEALGYTENPGDDTLVAELRRRFRKTGPEPTRWREFCDSALKTLNAINVEDLSNDPVYEELPRGQCGSRDEHKAHIHDSATLGRFRCGGLIKDDTR